MIIFRADGNEKIGSGHIMRCLSIADAFARKGIKSLFVLADDSCAAKVNDRGYETVVLDTDYSDLDSESGKLIEIVKETKPMMVIVDSYYVTSDYLKALTDVVKTVYIDDLASFAYPVNCVVNYNIYGPDIDYDELYKDSGYDPQKILGIEYVPVRAMFRDLPVKTQREEVKDILISTGGTDPLHLALKIIDRVRVADNKVTYHILVGALNSDYDEIVKVSSGITNIVIHHDVKDMKELISSCDVVISASGSTLYEVCACGVPMVVYALADNQLAGVTAFGERGLALSCGDIRKTANPVDKIFDEMLIYINNYKLRCSVGSKMQSLVDGRGADRIAAKLLDNDLEDIS